MTFLLTLHRGIDTLNRTIGRVASWAAMAMVLNQFLVVVLRYVFSVNYKWMQDGVLYFHSILFLLGAGYTLMHEGHVRVDIFYHRFPPRRKALANVLGAVFLLLPVCVLLWWWSWPYVAQSWAILEHSRDGGLPIVYLLKSLILIFAALLGLQGLAMLSENLLIMLGAHPDHEREDGTRI
ncbi:MAG: TRAP transporter small permease subunit [Alphaproteobacteria bacterium]|nr:TRAP transporter small permease subunit [Alphaproteobacteria bacterium]